MPNRVLRALLSVVMFAGILLALWPLGQSVYANWNQQQLHAQWQSEQETKSKQKPQKVESSAAIRPATAQQSAQPKRSARPEFPHTRLVIPAADVDVVVLDGWDESTLKKAPGHWPTSAQPGQKGNCAIAGHRNVYGSPFYKVDVLQPGAPIELRTPDATYLYRVIEVKAVADADTTVIQPSPDPEMPPLLTLVTCTLPRTSSRIVVSAALEPSA